MDNKPGPDQSGGPPRVRDARCGKQLLLSSMANASRMIRSRPPRSAPTRQGGVTDVARPEPFIARPEHTAPARKTDPSAALSGAPVQKSSFGRIPNGAKRNVLLRWSTERSKEKVPPRAAKAQRRNYHVCKTTPTKYRQTGGTRSAGRPKRHPRSKLRSPAPTARRQHARAQHGQ